MLSIWSSPKIFYSLAKSKLINSIGVSCHFQYYFSYITANISHIHPLSSYKNYMTWINVVSTDRFTSSSLAASFFRPSGEHFSPFHG